LFIHLFILPLSNSLHHLHTCCTVNTLAPYTLTGSRRISMGGNFAHKKRMTEHNSSFVHSFSMVAILRLLLCLFTSPEVVTITNIWWWIYVLTKPMLANSIQESFQQE
jgi:hypothetical protein